MTDETPPPVRVFTRSLAKVLREIDDMMDFASGKKLEAVTLGRGRFRHVNGDRKRSARKADISCGLIQHTPEGSFYRGAELRCKRPLQQPEADQAEAQASL